MAPQLRGQCAELTVEFPNLLVRFGQLFAILRLQLLAD